MYDCYSLHFAWWFRDTRSCSFWHHVFVRIVHCDLSIWQFVSGATLCNRASEFFILFICLCKSDSEDCCCLVGLFCSRLLLLLLLMSKCNFLIKYWRMIQSNNKRRRCYPRKPNQYFILSVGGTGLVMVPPHILKFDSNWCISDP